MKKVDIKLGIELEFAIVKEMHLDPAWSEVYKGPDCPSPYGESNSSRATRHFELKAMNEAKVVCKGDYIGRIIWGCDGGATEPTGGMPELRFPPVKYSEFIEEESNIENLLAVIKNNNFEGDNYDSGMHIHVQRDFVEKKEFYKIIEFFGKNSDFITKFSERGHRAINYVHPLTRIGSTKEGIQRTYREMDSRYSIHTDGQECIRLNNPGGTPTVEFRLFNATLEPNKFIANVQFVERLINFVKVSDDLSLKAFIDYILSERLLYRELIRDLKSKQLLTESDYRKLRVQAKEIFGAIGVEPKILI